MVLSNYFYLLFYLSYFYVFPQILIQYEIFSSFYVKRLGNRVHRMYIFTYLAGAFFVHSPIKYEYISNAFILSIK